MLPVDNLAYARMLPHLTIYTGRAEPDRRLASPIVRAAMDLQRGLKPQTDPQDAGKTQDEGSSRSSSSSPLLYRPDRDGGTRLDSSMGSRSPAGPTSTPQPGGGCGGGGTGSDPGTVYTLHIDVRLGEGLREPHQHGRGPRRRGGRPCHPHPGLDGCPASANAMIAAADLSGAAPGQGGFLHWWREELAAAMPRRQLQARPPRNILFLRRNGDDIELFRRRGKAASRLGTLTLPAPLPARAGESIGRALPPESRRLITLLRRRRVPAVLLLEPDEGLLCDDRLPAGAAADIDRIMPHRVDLLTPWPADRVHAGYRLAGKRKDGQVDVLLGVAPRSGVDATLARLAAWGVTVDRVDLLREDGDPAELNLLAPRRKQPSRRWRVLGLLAFILLACGGALAGFEIYRLHERLQSRTTFADALQQRLADMPGLVSRIDTMRRMPASCPSSSGGPLRPSSCWKR